MDDAPKPSVPVAPADPLLKGLLENGPAMTIDQPPTSTQPKDPIVLPLSTTEVWGDLSRLQRLFLEQEMPGTYRAIEAFTLVIVSTAGVIVLWVFAMTYLAKIWKGHSAAPAIVQSAPNVAPTPLPVTAAPPKRIRPEPIPSVAVKAAVPIEPVIVTIPHSRGIASTSVDATNVVPSHAAAETPGTPVTEAPGTIAGPEHVKARVVTEGIVDLSWDTLGEGFTYRLYSAPDKDMANSALETDFAIRAPYFTWTARDTDRLWIVIRGVSPEGTETSSSTPLYIHLR